MATARARFRQAQAEQKSPGGLSGESDSGKRKQKKSQVGTRENFRESGQDRRAGLSGGLPLCGQGSLVTNAPGAWKGERESHDARWLRAAVVAWASPLPSSSLRMAITSVWWGAACLA